MGALRLYLGFCRRFTWQILVLVGLITLGAAFLASQLKIDADITRLLPPTAPSVAGLERLEKSYGGQIGRLTVVLEMASSGTPEDINAAPQKEQAQQKVAPDELIALAEEYAQILRGVQGVDRVETHRSMEFQNTYRLLFADIQDLRDAQTYLNQRIDRAEGRANPLFVELDEDERDPEQEPAPALLDPKRLAEKYPELSQSPYYIAENGRFLAFFVYPDFPPSNLGRSAELVAEVQRIVLQGVEKIAAQGGPKIQVGFTGRYKKRVDLEAMLQRDLALSTSLALGVLLLFLWLYLRSIRATLLVLVPLVVGVIWTFAWASIAFGSLNIMTAFLGAVLMGLGVDYGIHFFSRFRELRAKMPRQDALLEVFASAGRANIAAALTTICALGSLMISSFRAFYEFGVIAVGGLPLVLFAYVLLFPCAVGVAERWEFDLTRIKSRNLGQRTGQESTRLSKSATRDARVWTWLQRSDPGHPMRRLARLGRLASGILLIVVLAAAFGLPRLRLIQDFSVLQSTSAPSWELDKRINTLLGQSQTPTLILTDSAQGSARVVAELERRKARHHGPPLIDKVVSIQSLVPAEQPTKRALLAQIAKRLRDLPRNEQNAEMKRHIDEIERVLRAKPLTQDDLPEAILRPFSRIDGPDKGVVLVFPAVELSTVKVIDAWARVLNDLPGAEPGPGYDAISESFLLRDIIHTAKDDALWMLAITLAGLLLLSVLVFRDFTRISLQLGVLTLALAVALGVNGLVGSDFNFMNIVALPVWLGLGVDASFHVLLLGQRIAQGPNGGDIGEYLSAHFHLSGAISVAYLTSMIGFGTLLFAQHDGLFSLGLVAVLGLGSILLVNLLIQIILIAQNAEAPEASPESLRRSA